LSERFNVDLQHLMQVSILSLEQPLIYVLKYPNNFQSFLNILLFLVSGLRPGDLVTHINGESVQGLFHPQVLQILISGGEAVTLRATALETTTIKTGGRRRDPQSIKLARQSALMRTKTKSRRDDKVRRKSSLFSKLSRKKASAEMQQLVAGRESQAIWSAPGFSTPCKTPDFCSYSSSPGDSSSPSSLSG